MNNITILELNQIISELKPGKKISLDSLMSLIELKKTLKDSSEVYFSTLKEIMDSYEVSQNQNTGAFDLEKLNEDEINEINEKVRGLQLKETEIKNLNFFEKSEFAEFVSEADLNLNVIERLFEFLVKK